MEGLEAVELSYKYDVLKENQTFRFDSEYFRKSCLRKINQLTKLSSYKLETLFEVKGGKRLPLYANFTIDGVPYIRAEDIKNSFVEYSNSPCIPESIHLELALYQTKKDDLLLTIVGNSIGDIGIVKFDLKKCNLTENCVKITPNKKNFSYSNDYLFLFLMSHYGQVQIDREKVGTAQPKLAIERIRRFLIPTLSIGFQNHLESILIISHEKTKQSKLAYFSAETLLLDILGLSNVTKKYEIFNIKSLRESFEKTGRLDAEYYQLKYQNYQNHIFKRQEGWGILGKICHIKDDNFFPTETDEYQYIELSDVDKTGRISSHKTQHGKYLPSRARRKINTNDVLISSIEGSLSSCAIVEKSFNNALCSTGFYVINSNKFNSETLLILFKSELMQNILKQYCSGTILTAINKSDFLNLPLPIIDSESQTKIADLVKESFTLKAKSQRLLSAAKRAVEIAIEEDEQSALAFLQSEINVSELTLSTELG